MDLWNDNHVKMMKLGGNKNLRELLDVYEINRLKTDKSTLYKSRILDFYRKHLKSKVNNEKFERNAPEKSEALKNLSADTYSNTPEQVKNITTKPEDKFKSISSTTVTEETEVDDSFGHKLNGWMSQAMSTTKYIGEEIGTKLISTTTVVAETGSSLLDKGTVVADSDKVRSFAKTANDSINYVINKFFSWGGKTENNTKEPDTKDTKNNSNETAKIDFNNEVKFEKNKK